MRGLPEFGGELPVAALAEEIETPGAGQIRALITVAGNPVLSTPNGAPARARAAGLDFMVAIDIYLNETTRHAHVILPPTPPLEREHYDLVFHALAVRNTARYSPALFPPAAGRAPRLGDPRRLARRLDARRPLARARLMAARWSARLGPRRHARPRPALGPHGAGFAPSGAA